MSHLLDFCLKFVFDEHGMCALIGECVLYETSIGIHFVHKVKDKRIKRYLSDQSVVSWPLLIYKKLLWRGLLGHELGGNEIPNDTVHEQGHDVCASPLYTEKKVAPKHSQTLLRKPGSAISDIISSVISYEILYIITSEMVPFQLSTL